MRTAFDFYETPAWQTRALVKRVQIAGRVLECCVGDRSLANELQHSTVITNDVNPERVADFHLDATQAESWAQFPEVDWVVTNPPFNGAMQILKHAHAKARFGVVMLLRISFLEPTKERGPWLVNAPPQSTISAAALVLQGQRFYRCGYDVLVRLAEVVCANRGYSY